jgi:uncharacterized protein (TIGR02246 family)
MKITNSKLSVLLLIIALAICAPAWSQTGMQQPSTGMSQPQTGMQQPSTSQAVGSAEQEIRALEAQAIQAAQKNDPSFLEQHATDDYVGITGMGDMVTKSQVVQDMRSGKMRYQSLQPRDMNVRVYGNTAIVNGDSSINLVRDGKPISGDFRYTRVWVKQDGGWKIASFESTPIQPQAK